jgi:hypothetical protein
MASPFRISVEELMISNDFKVPSPLVEKGFRDEEAKDSKVV